MWTLCVVKLASWDQVSNFQGTLVTYRTAPVQVSLKIFFFWGGEQKDMFAPTSFQMGEQLFPMLCRP